MNEYQDFLHGARLSLSALGAHSIDVSLGGGATIGPGRGWDELMFNSAPGAQTLYAFADGRKLETSELQVMLDTLARWIANSGMLRALPVSLVAVIAVSPAEDRVVQRRLQGLRPGAFYTNLRPVVWIADLAARRVITPGIRTAEEATLLQGALSGSARLDASRATELQRTEMERTRAFYDLMSGRKPLVTYALIALNVIVFIFEMTNGGADNAHVLTTFGALVPRLVQQGQWWRLFTPIFLHASMVHIMSNMLSLFVLGTLAERFYGSARFIAIYLGAGLVGSLFSLGFSVYNNALDVPAVGASGAIFGLAGALITVRFQHSEVIPSSLRRRVSSSILPLVVLNFAILLFTPYVDNAAHLGGLLGGAALSFLFPLTRGFSTSTPSH